MNGPTFKHCATRDRASTKRKGVLLFQIELVLRRKPVIRNELKGVAFCSVNGCLIRLTQFGGRLDQRVEHGLKIKGRAADYLEHVGGGGLLVERLAQLFQ